MRIVCEGIEKDDSKFAIQETNKTVAVNLQNSDKKSFAASITLILFSTVIVLFLGGVAGFVIGYYLTSKTTLIGLKYALHGIPSATTRTIITVQF